MAAREADESSRERGCPGGTTTARATAAATYYDRGRARRRHHGLDDRRWTTRAGGKMQHEYRAGPAMQGGSILPFGV